MRATLQVTAIATGPRRDSDGHSVLTGHSRDSDGQEETVGERRVLAGHIGRLGGRRTRRLAGGGGLCGGCRRGGGGRGGRVGHARQTARHTAELEAVRHPFARAGHVLASLAVARLQPFERNGIM